MTTLETANRPKHIKLRQLVLQEFNNEKIQHYSRLNFMDSRDIERFLSVTRIRSHSSFISYKYGFVIIAMLTNAVIFYLLYHTFSESRDNDLWLTYMTLGSVLLCQELSV